MRHPRTVARGLARYGSQGDALEAISALDWDGTGGGGQRAVLFTSPLPAYPATYIWRVYQRQVTRGDNYHTTFFHGNRGPYVWGAGYVNSYYGAHPYPRNLDQSDNNGAQGQWEISTNTADYTLRDDGSAAFVAYDNWYSQALVVSASGGNLNHKFYINLPNVSTQWTITRNFAATYTAPPSPGITWGQSFDDGSGNDWGGPSFSGHEETNGRIRGVSIWPSALTESQILAIAAFEQSAQVKAYAMANSLTRWYINCNWKLGNVADQSGMGNHPSLTSTFGAAPAQWNG